MKDSGIEWIGDIPEEWEIRRLRFLCNITTGDKDTINRIEDGLYPFYVRSPNIERIDTYTFDGEAILMAGDGVGAGKVFHYVNGKFDYHQRVYNLHFFNDISGKYLYYYLKENFWKKIEESNAKSTVDSVRLPMLLDFPVVFGKLPEQIHIASFLDKKCAAIDSAIKNQRASIDKLKEYRQAVITEAVTKGLNPDVPMKDSGIEWIGEIPEGWEIGKIKYFTIFNPKYQGDLNDEEFVSFVPMECLTNGKISPKKRHIGDVKKAYTFFGDGDIIMAKVTPCFENGNLAVARDLLKGTGFGTSEIFVFRCVEINTQFFFYLLQNDTFKQLSISSMYGTGGLKRVSPDFIRNYKFANPPLHEQKEIAICLDKKCNLINETISKKETLIEKLEEYKKSLIYEAVTGKIEIPELSA